MSKKLSRNDLLRLNRTMSMTASSIINELVEEMAQIKMLAEILEDVAGMLANGEMTRHEGFQFMSRWKDYKHADGLDPEEVVEVLKLENLEENFNEILREYTAKAKALTVQFLESTT